MKKCVSSANMKIKKDTILFVTTKDGSSSRGSTVRGSVVLKRDSISSGASSNRVSGQNPLCNPSQLLKSSDSNFIEKFKQKNQDKGDRLL